MKFIIYLFNFFLLTTFQINATEMWNKTRDTDGILTYQKSVGSGILEVKGVVIINTGIDVAGNIFRSIELHPKWVGYCEKAQTLKYINRNHYLFYEVLQPPWPVARRDMILDAKSNYHNQELGVSIVSRAISSNAVPSAENTVRIKNMNVKVWLEYISPQKTGISYEIMVDPGGNIPEVIVNLFNQIYVYQIMESLRNIALDENYTKELDIAEDSSLLQTLVSDKKVMQNALKSRLSRFLDSRENIEYLVNDDGFFNYWVKNEDHFAEQLFLGDQDTILKNIAINKIIEIYLRRFDFSKDTILRLSQNTSIRKLFTNEILKDAITPDLIQKILSGKG